MSDKELMDRTTTAYHRRCVRNGWIYAQPNNGLSEVNGDMVVLRNLNGVLARYRLTKNGLRFVKDPDMEDGQ